MRSLLRFALAATAATVLVAPLAANAAAITYKGTASLTDSTNGNYVGFTAQTASFNFTNPPTSTYVVDLTIDATTFLSNDCIVIYQNSCTDNLSVNVSFTSPNHTGSDPITGTGTIDGSITSDGTIDWTGGEDQVVMFTDGTSVTLSLADLSAGSFTNTGSKYDPEYTATDALTISVNSVPTAAAPEPSSLILLGTGLLGSVGMMRRRFGC